MNELRKSAIPAEQHDEYLRDTIEDRLVNLFALVAMQSRSEWKKSLFYQDILDDMKSEKLHFSLKQKIFLLFPKIITKIIH